MLRKGKAQIATEFIVLYSVILLVFVVVFTVITTQRAILLNTQQYSLLQLQAQEVSSYINYALSAGNGYSVSLPLTSGIAPLTYNLSISNTGVVIITLNSGTQQIKAYAFSSGRDIVVNGTLQYGSNGINVYKIPTYTGLLNISNFGGVIYIDSPSSHVSNFGLVGAVIPKSISESYVPNFNGENSIITVQDANVLRVFSGKPFTIELWFHPTTSNSMEILSKGNLASAGYDIGIKGANSICTSNQISVTLYTTGTVCMGYLPNDNNWHQLIIAYPSYLSIDGNVTTLPSNDMLSTTTQNAPLTFGVGAYGKYFSGQIVNVQFYNVTLTKNQISTSYLSGVFGYPVLNQNLTGWWQLNGNPDDYSGLGHNGQSSNILYSSAADLNFYDIAHDGYSVNTTPGGVVLRNASAQLTTSNSVGTGAVDYVPINIHNSQSSNEPSTYPQMITVNSIKYSSVEAGDLGNIRFYEGSNELYSWCESLCNTNDINQTFETAYVYLTVANHQSVATEAPFQQMISINPSSYSSYEAPDLGNIRFYLGTNAPTTANELYSWCDTQCSSSYSGSNAIFWIKLPSGIAANSNVVINMTFQNQHSGNYEYDDNYAGEASNYSPYNGAGFDNGQNVFLSYASVFVNSSIDYGNLCGDGNDYYFNNVFGGTPYYLNINGGFQFNGACQYETMFTVDTPITEPNVIAESNYNLNYTGNTDVYADIGAVGLSADTASDNPQAAYIGAQTSNATGLSAYGEFFQDQVSNTGALSTDENQCANGPLQYQWLYAGLNYSSSSTTYNAYISPILYDINPSDGACSGTAPNQLHGMSTVYLSVLGNTSVDNNYDGNVSIAYNWLRARSTPPKGVMPTVSFSSTNTFATYQYANTTFWFKIPSQIAANSNAVVNMSFLPTSTEYDGVYAGEAPELSHIYAEFDNGKSVFSYYTNFPGLYASDSGLPANWISVGTGTSYYQIDNGLTVGSSAIQGGIEFNSLYNPENVITDWFGDFGPGGEACWNCEGFSNTPGLQGSSGSYSFSSPAYLITSSGSYFEYCNILVTGCPFGIIGGSSTTNTVISEYSTTNSVYMLLNYQGGLIIGPLGYSLPTSGFFVTTGGGAGATTFLQWFRERTTPTGDAMPTYSFGSLTPVSSQGNTNSTKIYTYTNPNTYNTLSGWEIKVTNAQNSNEPSPFQQMVNFNAITYNAYEASDLGNIRFYQGTTELYSWCESGCVSNSANAIFWVKLPNGIPATSNVIINMTFRSTSTDYDGVYAGEAPQLTCTNPSNTVSGCSAGQYAKYDNGNSIFNFYDNFAGNTLASDWSVSSPFTEIVNNGITIGASTSGSSSGGLINTYSPSFPIVIDWYDRVIASPSTFFYGTNIGGYNNDVLEIVSGDWQYWILGSGYNTGIGVSQGGNSVVSFFATSTTQNTLINYTTHGTPYSVSVSSGALRLQDYDAGAATTAGGYYQWLRTRAYPANGVMPSTSFIGPLYTTSYLSTTLNPQSLILLYNNTNSNATVYAFNGNLTTYNSLVGWWPLTQGDASAGNYIYDLSQSSVTATSSNILWSYRSDENVFTGARFPASPSIPISINYAGSLINVSKTNNLTVVAWVKFLGGSGSCQGVFGSGGKTSTGIQLMGYTNSGSCAGAYVDDVPINAVSPLLSTGNWTMLTLSINNVSKQAYLYRNNVLLSNIIDSSYSLTPSNGIYYIGSDSQGTSDSFNGIISNVQLYSSPLSPSKISSLYSEGPASLPLPGSGLIGWWPLNGNANDYSGSGNSGTPPSVQTYPTQQYAFSYNTTPLQRVATFNGLDYISIPYKSGSKLSISGPFSFGFWFSSAYGSNYSFTSELLGSATTNSFNLQLCGAKACGLTGIKFQENNIPSSAPTHYNFTFYPKTWYYVAGTFGTNSFALYLNGVNVTSNTYVLGSNTPTFMGTANVLIGQNGNSAFQNFNGQLADLQVYNAVLTSSQINQLYQQGLPPQYSTRLSIG